MGRPSKKSRLIAGQRTAAGTFGCKATNALPPAAEKRSNLQYRSDKSSDGDAIDMILEDMGEKGFAAMVEASRKAAYPKWYARAKGYDGRSRTSIWRKNKNRKLVLEAVPMRGINTYFGKKTITATMFSECCTAEEAATTATAVRELMATAEVLSECATAAAEEAATTATVVREHMMWCYGLIEELWQRIPISVDVVCWYSTSLSRSAWLVELMGWGRLSPQKKHLRVFPREEDIVHL